MNIARKRANLVTFIGQQIEQRECVCVSQVDCPVPGKNVNPDGLAVKV